MNDTHPTVAVAELMRILLDEEGLTWDEAWDDHNTLCAYTNHTIMAEALEKWPIDIFSASASACISDRGRDQPPFCRSRSCNRYPVDEDKVARWQFSTTDR